MKNLRIQFLDFALFGLYLRYLGGFACAYVKTFINSTVNFTTNDCKQIPIIIPTSTQLKDFEAIFDRAYTLQVEKFQHNKNNEKSLAQIQTRLDSMVYKLYGLEFIE